MKMNKEEAFDAFYFSKEAQEYCFGNHNNSIRDEQVGEFSFNAGYEAAKIEMQTENLQLRALVRTSIAIIEEQNTIITNDEFYIKSELTDEWLEKAREVIG